MEQGPEGNKDGGKLMQLRSYEVRTPADIEKAFAEMSKARPDALFVLLSPLITLNSKRIVELALEQRLPGMYPTNQFAEEGGLMAYGPRIGDMYRRAAAYVDKILKGAKPGDLPIEQPTKFELVVNLKAGEANRSDDSTERAGAGGPGDQVTARRCQD